MSSAVNGEPHADRAVLQTAALSIDEVVARVHRPEAGALAIFVGTVRDHNEGRDVVQLEHEAYPSMAVAEMNRILAEIEREIPGVVLAVAHRTGSLGVGEAAVVCAASLGSPRRGPACLPGPHRPDQGARPHLEARARPERRLLGGVARRSLRGRRGPRSRPRA